MCRTFEQFVREQVNYEPELTIKNALARYDADRVCPQPETFVDDLQSTINWAFRKTDEVDTGHLINALAISLNALYTSSGIKLEIPKND